MFETQFGLSLRAFKSTTRAGEWGVVAGVRLRAFNRPRVLLLSKMCNQVYMRMCVDPVDQVDRVRTTGTAAEMSNAWSTREALDVRQGMLGAVCSSVGVSMGRMRLSSARRSAVMRNTSEASVGTPKTEGGRS